MTSILSWLSILLSCISTFGWMVVEFTGSAKEKKHQNRQKKCQIPQFEKNAGEDAFDGVQGCRNAATEPWKRRSRTSVMRFCWSFRLAAFTESRGMLFEERPA